MAAKYGPEPSQPLVPRTVHNSITALPLLDPTLDPSKISDWIVDFRAALTPTIASRLDAAGPPTFNEVCVAADLNPTTASADPAFASLMQAALVEDWTLMGELVSLMQLRVKWTLHPALKLLIKGSSQQPGVQRTNDARGLWTLLHLSVVECSPVIVTLVCCDPPPSLG